MGAMTLSIKQSGDRRRAIGGGLQAGARASPRPTGTAPLHPSPGPVCLEVERPYQEHRHLGTCHGVERAVVCVATPHRDAEYGHALDEGIEGVPRRHIEEALHRRQWRAELTERADDEGSHLLTRDRRVGTIVASPTADRKSVV